MTPQEYEAWLEETRKSEHQWRIDPIHSDRTTGELFAYTGGVSGNYVWVGGSKVIIGTYEGAIPHIGEACFTILYESKEYESNFAAAAKAFQGMDVGFLLNQLAPNANIKSLARPKVGLA